MADIRIHLQCFVQLPLTGNITLRNLCTILSSQVPYRLTGELQGPTTFADESHGNSMLDMGRISCSRCQRALKELSQSLYQLSLVHRTPEQIAEQDRAWEVRRWSWNKDSFVKEVRDVAARYRRWAEESERLLARYFPEDVTLEDVAKRETGYGQAFDLVNTLQHELAWGVANLGLDTLARRAVELDQTTRRATGGR